MTLDYSEMDYIGYPAILQLDGTAGFLMLGPALFGGTGTQSLADALATVPLDPHIINASGEDIEAMGSMSC